MAGIENEGGGKFAGIEIKVNVSWGRNEMEVEAKLARVEIKCWDVAHFLAVIEIELAGDHVVKKINLKRYNICNWNPQTKCGFHLVFANSACDLQIRLTVADSATAQLNYTHFLLFDCEFHKMFWNPQNLLRIS